MVRNTEQQLNLGRTLYKILFLFFYTRSHIVQTGLLPYLSARITGTCHRHHAWLFQILKHQLRQVGCLRGSTHLPPSLRHPHGLRREGEH